MNRKFLLILITAYPLMVLGAEKKTELRGGEFPTMKACVDVMKRVSGGPLELATDTPEKVAGHLANGEFFQCKKVVTGSKGTYFDGVYDHRL